jgi:hypothetical protein
VIFLGQSPARAIQKNKIVIAHHDLTPAMIWWNRMHANRVSDNYRGIIAAHFKPVMAAACSEIAL